MIFETKRSTFESVVRAYAAELYRYAYGLCRDSFKSEDLVQETFARAWSAWGDLRDEASARSWLYTILRNERARMYGRERLKIDPEKDLDTLVDARVNIAEDYAIRNAVLTLPPAYREPLLLQWIGGYSCKEIAGIMNLTEGAVMTRLTRARIALGRVEGSAEKRKGAAR